MRCFIFIFLILFFSQFGFSQQVNDPLLSVNNKLQKRWVDSVYNTLSLKEKVGQLYTVQVFSNQDDATKQKILELIKNHHIGGVIYSKGDPTSQAKLDNELQAMSQIPLLVSMDAEWGLSMRLDNTFSFPWNMTLGAIQDNGLIEQTGRQIGEHCKRLGVHLNFAPVVDINTNPKNPIIGNRSFGENRDNVTQKALAFMKGIQSAGVLANAKHFPGHGDTETDSHKTLPTIHFDKKRIDSVEIYPYKKLIKNGLSSVMVAHLNVPSLETRSNFPSSLSKHIITDILKDSLGFNGLVISDALTMKGAADFDESGDIDLAAFLAGNDILLMSENPSVGITKITDAYHSGVITETRLEHSVKKILKAKFKAGLNHYKPIELDNLVNDLNRIKDTVLYESLIENALTIIKNKRNILPIKRLETKRIAYVKMGDDDGSYFLDELKKYTKIHQFKADNLDELLVQLQSYNTVIIGFHRSNDSPWKNYKFTDRELTWLHEIARTNTLILDMFVKPYDLSDLRTIENVEGIILSYQNSPLAQQKSAQLIFGAIPSKGTLPVSIGTFFKVGDGIKTNSLQRLGYTIPERVGMSSKKLKKIDSVAQYAINHKMTPGIQLLVARKGKVIYNKNFGKHTYDGNKRVTSNDIYDLASLTKILGTLPLLMELEEQGILSLDSKLSDLLPEYKKSNKKDITIKQLLSHYARLKPWIPFYAKTLDSITKRPSPKYYKHHFSNKYNIEVGKNLYLRRDFSDSIHKIIKDSELLNRLQYRYSDLPYYILKKFIEKHYNKPLDELVQDHFYESLGANMTMYTPYRKISDKNIVPTEIDDYFRHQEIHGYVNDKGAAMQNGVGGHAGLFSNANDVAKIMQMYLQKGIYGGKHYFKPETINKFNTCYYCGKDNRRGIGFDKPQLDEEGPTCGCVSMTSFGHSGFTGTYAWADPDEDIVYVFLANRTYPNAEKNLLLSENIRTEIQRLIYEAIVD